MSHAGSQGLTLVELELSRHDWQAMRCGCPRRADHLKEDLWRLVRAESEEEASLDGLCGHVWLPPLLMEPAVPALSVVLAALETDISLPARVSLLSVMESILGSDGQPPHVTSGRNLYEERLDVGRAGLWTLYSEAIARRTRQL